MDELDGELGHDPSGEGRQPEARTNVRGAWIFAIAVIVVAIVAIGLFLAAGGSDAACSDWEDAKTEWVATFPPIQQNTKSDLADFQGWVELNGQRVDRPKGCT